MNLVFVVYAFLLGAVMDIGSMIGPTEVRAVHLMDTEAELTQTQSVGAIDQFYTDSEQTRILVAATDADLYRDPEPATAVGKSAKKSKNSQQHPDQGTPTTPPTRELLVQTGRDCSITTHAASGDYRLRATKGGTATVVFSERPVQTAGIIATKNFVENFDKLFNTSAPNAAITFARDTEDAVDTTGPLIVELSQPRIIGSSIIEYTLIQSKSQGAVASIAQFIDMSGVSCSIFIDNIEAKMGFTRL